MKVYVIKRGAFEKEWLNNNVKNIIVHYCGYLQFDDDTDIESIDLWNLCNWGCWSNDCPDECKNLLIDHCNSDVAFYNGKWYNHRMEELGSFDECYNAMIAGTHSFRACWPILEGFGPEIKEDDIQIIKSEKDFNEIL